MTTHLPLTGSSALTGVTVSEAMRPGVIACPRDATLPTIAATMITHAIHAVMVSPLASGPPLVVTDMDLVRAAVPGDDHVTAGELAREPIITVAPSATVADAVELMARRYVTHLLVSDPPGAAPSGIISSLDVAACAGRHEPRLTRMVRPAPARPASSARTLSAASVGEVMHPGLVTCTPDTPLFTVAAVMADHRVHCVAVAGVDAADERDHQYTWGLITDMDLMVALHRDSTTASAAMVAAAPPIAVHETDSLQRAAELMVEHQVTHVAAVGRDGLPTGMVATLDVARVVAARR